MLNDSPRSIRNAQANHFYELWRVIIRSLPYATRVWLRGISKIFTPLILEVSNLPLLTTKDVNDAAKYFQKNSSKVANDKQARRRFTISPSIDSQDSLIARLVSTNPALDNDLYIDDSLTVYTVSVRKILEKATFQRISRIQQQYAFISTHSSRRKFIDDYLALPFTIDKPRWHYLNEQSMDSLKKLIKSLKRRQDDRSKNMFKEVEEAIRHRNQDKRLSKAMKKLKI